MTPRVLLNHIVKTFHLPKIRVTQACPLVERDHSADSRVYAHVFHREWVICFCKAYSELSLPHQVGVMLHEIGHVMSNGGEAEADLWVDEQMGIDINFKDTLQWVAPCKVGL